MWEFDPIYLIYLFVGASAALFAEGVYLLSSSTLAYRSNVNRRLQLMKDKTDRETILVELRRERGLTKAGDYKLSVASINQLILQSGVTLGIGKLALFIVIGAAIAFGATLVWRGQLMPAIFAALFSATVLPYMVLRFLRARRQKKFGAQFPDALEMIVRSLRAGHPVPIAVAMVAREMADPIGTEFGLVVDEITYGSDLEGALRNLYFRVGTDDLPLFVTAVAIQGSTGGNLSEILENLSGVIRLRFKMRRKIKALAAEGRASALILSSLPIGIFLVIQIVAPEFYASVWHVDMTKISLAAAAAWMGLGNFIMYRMVNFKI
jgi:tight adherence protein B